MRYKKQRKEGKMKLEKNNNIDKFKVYEGLSISIELLLVPCSYDARP